ncbi:leucine rich repeats and WD repeat domain containing 1 [Phyllostomus discolor]|nr:leucine rich repeats and WD repeat domain containing 1 [Phyllostomus discolor]
MISEELLASSGTQMHEADIPEKSLKATAAQEPRARPVASKRLDDIPLSLSPSKRVCASPPAQAEGRLVGSGGSQPAPKLEPLHFLQCHSKNNSPQDLETQLWACAFEPAWNESTPLAGKHTRATSQTVATCGGEAVCVIDCQTGIVLHKYKVPGEEFFSVAWTALTVVTQAGHKRRWSILAAAGLRGQVRLLHVRAGFCCGVIRAHKKAIATLCFSPTHETHLFTASYDKKIILWDIGVPDQDYNFQASQLLTLDTTSTPLRLCPVASCPDAYLLAGCEGGCCCWDVRLDQPQKRRVCEVEFVFSEGSEASGQRVDGLAFVNEDVVGEQALLGAVWPPGTLLRPRQCLCELLLPGPGVRSKSFWGGPHRGTRNAWRGPPRQFFILPHSLQGECPGHHLPVELEPDVAGPGQPVRSAGGGPGSAAVVTHGVGLFFTQHLSW